MQLQTRLADFGTVQDNGVLLKDEFPSTYRQHQLTI